DHVPVEPRGVRAARLGERRAKREMHRAADLLVAEDVAGEAVDLVVETERDLAEDAGAFVHGEEGTEVVVAAGCLRLDDATILEAQAYVLHLATVVDRRERVADGSLSLRLRGAREHLSVGHVVAPVGRDPLAAL